MKPFTWGDGGAQLTPDQIAQQRKVAQALMEQASDTSPIQHWSQGANRVLQGLMGGYDSHVADKAEKANAEENKLLIASLLAGGTAPVPTSTASAPMASNPPAMTGGTPSPVAMAPSVSNKIYSNDEPSPLDPPSGKDRDLAIRTVYGEDPGSSALGVANVIRNRAVAGKFGGDTIPGVVLAKNQFEPWNTDAARARMQSLDPNSAEYKRLGGIVDQAWTGTNDPTNGATHFFAPKAQAALGRPVPAWGQQGGQDIGVHRFFGGAANPTMVATNAVPPAMSGARPGAPVQPSQTTWGDREAEAAGLYEKPATVAQRSVGAPGAPADPAALPTGATPAQYVAPDTGQPIAPAAAPAAPARPAMNPALVAALTNPRASPAVQKIAGMMLQQQMAQSGVTNVDLGNEVGIMDKAGNIVRRIPKSRDPLDAEGKALDLETKRKGLNAAPTTKVIKQADGSEVAVQWDADAKDWKPLRAPEGGNAVTSPKLTEQQSKDVGFYNRAEKLLPRLEKQDKDLTDAFSAAGGSVSNYFKTESYRNAEQTGRELLAVILRKDTGAAVTPAEDQLYGSIYLPKPGDDSATIAQKREARKTAIEGLRMGLGPGEIIFRSREAAEAAKAAPAQLAPPKSGEVKDGYRFRGGDPSKRESWERVN